MRTVPRRLVTARLVLEATNPSHAAGMYDAVRASLPELEPWMPWAKGSTYEDTLDFATRTERAWDEGKAWGFTILLDEEVVGSIGFDHHDPLVGAISLGYWLRSDLAGQGLMTEAAAAVVEFGFDALGLHRIQLQAGTDNYASARVAEKLRFVREGVMRDGSKGAHGWHDTYLYGLLEEDERVASSGRREM
jgi:ribosomal-protein-serine acetyltransferase